MELKFYNTLTHRIETFKEIISGKIDIYTCGPTVYDYAHIGNFRTYIFEDLVKRYLAFSGYKVHHVMNITDIDDKTIKKANDQKQSLKEVTAKYIHSFFEDITTLNIIKADVYPRATEHIPEMIDIIEKLLKNSYAYKKDNSVYFSVSQFPDYGKLANISKDFLKIGISVDADEYDKENVQDFVLWKGKKEGEPFWPSPFGPGRPGWHIECSAMSMKYLGEHFDIHMGGVDNIFPHHENEIAQSVCATGKPFVNYWIHAQHLIVDQQKMSKSLGNFYTLRDIINKGYDPMVIRFLLLSTHYRKHLNFTFDSLEQSSAALHRIKDFIYSLKTLTPEDGKTDDIHSLVENAEKDFCQNLNDDFNISGGLGIFFDFIRQINLKIKDLKRKDIEAILLFCERINSILGVLSKDKDQSLEKDVLEKINQREKSRKEKNFKLADQIRDELKSRGIILIDTADGVRWKYQ